MDLHQHRCCLHPKIRHSFNSSKKIYVLKRNWMCKCMFWLLNEQYMHIYLKHHLVRKLSNIKDNCVAAPISILSSSSSSSRISPSDPTALIIPDAPLPCDRSDFLPVDVGWSQWTRKDWISYVEKQRVNGSGFRKLLFITDQDAYQHVSYNCKLLFLCIHTADLVSGLGL